MLARSAWTVLLIFGLLVVGTGCPGREPPPAPPPEVVVPEEPPEPGDAVRVAQDLLGLASIMVMADEEGENGCALEVKSERSEAWRANPHIWVVASRCPSEARVELLNFRKGGVDDNPFTSPPPYRVVLPGRGAKPLRLEVRPDANLGTYTYDIEVNEKIYDPEIEIRDPPM